MEEPKKESEMRAIFILLLFLASPGFNTAAFAEPIWVIISNGVLCSSPAAVREYLNAPWNTHVPDECEVVEEGVQGFLLEQVEYDGPHARATIARYKIFPTGDKYGYQNLVRKSNI